jgi:hypothetical protein
MTSLNIIYGKKGDEVKIDDKLIIIKNNYRLITDEDSCNKYYEIETNNKTKFKINEEYLLKIICVKIDDVIYNPLWFYKDKRIFANIQNNNDNYNINIIKHLFDKINDKKFRYIIRSDDEYDYRIENIKTNIKVTTTLENNTPLTNTPLTNTSISNKKKKFIKMNSPPLFYKQEEIRILKVFENNEIKNKYKLVEIINEVDKSKKRYYEIFIGVNNTTQLQFSFIVDEVSLPKILQLNINNTIITNHLWEMCNNQYIWVRPQGNKSIYLHRYLSGCINGDNKTIDHINNNKLDNRLSNLKVATMTEQNMNRPNVNRKHDLNSILNPIQITLETAITTATATQTATPATQLSIPKIETKSLLFITKKKSVGLDYFSVEISKARTRVEDIRDNSSKSSLLTLKEKLGHVIYKRYMYICKYPIIMKEQIDGKTFTTLDEFKIHSEVKLNEILTTEQPNTIIYTLDSFLDYLNTKKIPKYIDPRIKDRLNTNITTVQTTTNTSEPILYTYKSDDKFTFIDNGKNSRDISIKISNNIKDNIRFSGSGSKKLTNEEKLCHTLMNRYFILIIHENNINLEIHKDNLTTINNNIVNKNTTGKKTLSDLIIDGYKFTHFDEFKKHTEKIIKDIMISVIPNNLFTIDTINTYFINKINDKRYNKPIPLLTNNYPILTT